MLRSIALPYPRVEAEPEDQTAIQSKDFFRRVAGVKNGVCRGANLFNAGAVQGPGGRTCPTEPANTRLHMHENLTYTDMHTHTIQFAADILARSAAGTRQCESRRKNENNLS